MTRSGRSGTWRFHINRQLVLARSRRCGICGHDGAETVDHIVPAPHWPKGRDGRPTAGFDDLPNLQPAHGTMGSGRDRRHNYCPVCRRLCNQSRGATAPVRPQSRDWF